MAYGGDYKEGLKIGRDLPMDHPLVQAGLPLHGSNQWPEGMDQWQQTMNQYRDASQQIGQYLMSAFALALDVDQNYFAHMLTEPMVTPAPLHYPPAPKGKISGAGIHSDYGCLTMVCQKDIPGLQVLNKQENRWLNVPVIEDSLIVNIGDMLQRWSNNTYMSTPHRVVNSSEYSRYSLAFFYDPNYDALLECIPSCRNQQSPALYPPMRAGEYMLNRMNISFSS